MSTTEINTEVNSFINSFFKKLTNMVGNQISEFNKNTEPFYQISIGTVQMWVILT